MELTKEEKKALLNFLDYTMSTYSKSEQIRFAKDYDIFKSIKEKIKYD